MKSILKGIIHWIRNPYVVIAHWEGKRFAHNARSKIDALDWMKCYPIGAMVRITNRWGKLVAVRTTN